MQPPGYGGSSLNSVAKRVAEFGLLTALSIVLGLADRAIPLSALLGGAVPGIKLGLANTVLLYAVYLLDWRGCVLLMLAKVFLSGFIFGSLSAVIYSLSGGVLSLALMLVSRRNPPISALAAAMFAAASEAVLLSRSFPPRGSMLWVSVLTAAAFVFALSLFFLLRHHPSLNVMAVSMVGATAHNIGQVLAAAAILRTPQLLYSYLPVLVGIGAAVGCLTGLVAQRVFHALRLPVAEF